MITNQKLKKSLEEIKNITSFDAILYSAKGKHLTGTVEEPEHSDIFVKEFIVSEVDEGGKDNDNAATLKSIANVHEENIYIKSDGSLEDGFEIVSHPMTLEYHAEEMNWKELLREAVSMGYRSHQTSTCGLHVHVNRNAFGDNQAEQEDVISRILFFVEKHWNERFTFSRRSSYNMSRWSARFGFEKTGKQILEKTEQERQHF